MRTVRRLRERRRLRINSVTPLWAEEADDAYRGGCRGAWGACMRLELQSDIDQPPGVDNDCARLILRLRRAIG